MSRRGGKVPAIFSAPWVVPMVGPVIRDGAVSVKDGRIVGVGPASGIRAACSGWEECRCRGVLMPALVNAHIHLELSHLGDIRRPAATGQMCEWIEELIRRRGERGPDVHAIERARSAVLADQRRAGVVRVADIGNGPHQPDQDPSALPQVMHIQEFLAPTAAATEAAAAAIAVLPDSRAATAHAPYSTSPTLIRLLHQRAVRLQQVFSLHVAESQEENRFLQSAAGSFRAFLERRGAWDGSISAGIQPPGGAVTYLHRLGVLDSGTLCVHCVHMNEDEMRLLVETGAHVCLCPGSNRFLRAGSAPVELMLSSGILPALGTDSAASNEVLDIWREMRILKEEHPDVPSEQILRMATLGGAQALRCANDFGSLATGRQALFLEVDCGGPAPDHFAAELFDRLVTDGQSHQITWIDGR